MRTPRPVRMVRVNVKKPATEVPGQEKKGLLILHDDLYVLKQSLEILLVLHFLRKDGKEHIVADWILVLGLLHESVVGLDGTLLTLDILFQHLNDERVV